MNLPEFGVKRPVTNMMIFLGIIIIALYGLSQLGVDLMPEIEPPIISVIAVYPGASPEDVELKVAEPLENRLSTTPGLDKITTRCIEGAAIISLEFKWGTNLDEASNDIRDRIEMAKRTLPDIPDEMDNPIIFKFNTANIPILVIVASAEESFSELYEILDRTLGDELKQIPGVGTVIIRGGIQRQINVWINSDRLEAYGFSISDIEKTLREENITLPAGNIKYGLTDYLIRVPGEFTSPDEIECTIIGQKDGKIVYLRDVATVEDGFKEMSEMIRIDRATCGAVIIQKQVGHNTVQVTERVKKKVEQIKKKLPADIKLHTVFDSSEDIERTLNTLQSTIWMGIMLVILVVWFFLRNLRSSLIVAFTIPFSLLISFIYLFVNEKTINVISLSALVIALGMIVDAAIVVVDNITRHMEKGERPKEASVFGTMEILTAIGASTLTTIVVFLPLLFVKGIVGIMFGEMAAIIIVTLVGSLFTASTFTPMLSSKWIGAKKKISSKSLIKGLYDFSENVFRKIELFYSEALKKCLGHKAVVLLSFLVTFIFSLSLFFHIGSDFLPEEDSGDLMLNVNLPVGTRVEVTDKIALRLEDIVSRLVPEKVFMSTFAGQPSSGMGMAMGGETGSHIIQSRVKIVPQEQRERSDKEIARILRQEISKIPGVIKLNITAGNPLGQMITGGGGKKIQVEILGYSFEKTNAFAREVMDMMEKIPGVVDISMSRDLRNPEIKIIPDRKKALSFGISMRTFADTVNAYIGGATATRLREEGETYDIVLRLEEPFRSTIEDIKNMPIISPVTKNTIKLGDIAKVVETTGPVSIERKNRERVLKVEANVSERSLGEIVSDIKKGLEIMTLPDGISTEFGGEAEEQRKSFRDLTLLLILGIILVYMVMAAQFESLRDPF
ncbi:MAG: efflux RND transporter permease subunit, partial [Candidatus Aureabacteria bacterium]|nr:efflux RND transporter permease subunit [Candidatus Auribacterota bacterium]